MIGELTRAQKFTSFGLVVALFASIFVQTFLVVYKANAQELPIAAEQKLFVFFGPDLLVTEKYTGVATPDGAVGTVRSLIIKATKETANTDAYTWINISFPKENPSGCLQVFDRINTWIHFSVCDPSEWDKRAWFIFAIALGAGAYLGGIWGVIAVGLFGIFAGVLIE